MSLESRLRQEVDSWDTAIMVNGVPERYSNLVGPLYYGMCLDVAERTLEEIKNPSTPLGKLVNPYSFQKYLQRSYHKAVICFRLDYTLASFTRCDYNISKTIRQMRVRGNYISKIFREGGTNLTELRKREGYTPPALPAALRELNWPAAKTEFQKRYFWHHLTLHLKNLTQTAEAVGMSRMGLRNSLRKHGLYDKQRKSFLPPEPNQEMITQQEQEITPEARAQLISFVEAELLRYRTCFGPTLLRSHLKKFTPSMAKGIVGVIMQELAGDLK